MKLPGLNKMFGSGGNKVTPEQIASYDLETAKLNARSNLTGDEANAVGRAVALAAEQASVLPSTREARAKVAAMVAPTPAEQAAIDAAIAAWEACRETTRQARRAAEGAAADALEMTRAAERGYAVDAGELGRLRAAVRDAGRVLERAALEESRASEDLGHLRGELVLAGKARVRELVSAGLL